LIASAFGPVCGMIGMSGDAPVVLNCPSRSRLPGAFWQTAALVMRMIADETAKIGFLDIEASPKSPAFGHFTDAKFGKNARISKMIRQGRPR
jgi:hypothetical protein